MPRFFSRLWLWSQWFAELSLFALVVLAVVVALALITCTLLVSGGLFADDLQQLLRLMW